MDGTNVTIHNKNNFNGMFSMFFRFFCLLLMSSCALGDGITIIKDNVSTTIDSVTYEEPGNDEATAGTLTINGIYEGASSEPEITGVKQTIEVVRDDRLIIIPIEIDSPASATSWEEVSVNAYGLDSIERLNIPFNGERAGIILEQANKELNILYTSSHLNKITISLDGSSEEVAYPAINNEFNHYGLIEGVPYILDQLNNTLWKWDVDYWKDLGAGVDLPNGEFNGLYSWGNQTYISTEDSIDGGVWKIGLDLQQVSTIPFSPGVRLFQTINGLLQVYGNDDGEYIFNWFDQYKEDLIVDVNPLEFPSVTAMSSSSGTYFSFRNSDSFRPYWLSADSASFELLQFPLDTTYFSGCYSSFPRVFCILGNLESGLSMYELVDGEFVLDSYLGEQLKNTSIGAVHAVGENRFISGRTEGDIYYKYHLFSVTKNGVFEIVNEEAQSHGDVYYLYPSRELGVFYFVGSMEGDVQLYKGVAAGDLTFKRLLEPQSEIDENPIDPKNLDEGGDVNPEDENESESESESEIGIASLQSYLLMMLIALLILPIRNREV